MNNEERINEEARLLEHISVEVSKAVYERLDHTTRNGRTIEVEGRAHRSCVIHTLDPDGQRRSYRVSVNQEVDLYERTDQ